MTAQSPERLILDGRIAALSMSPLSPLIRERELEIHNPYGGCTSHWRGYTGTWEIIDGMLHLVHINVGRPSEESPMPADMFQHLLSALPGNRLPAPATWFTGMLAIPIGRRLLYVHHGFGSVYSKERRIAIEAGRVASDEIVDTGAALKAEIEADAALRAHLGVPKPDDEPQSIPFRPCSFLDKIDDDVPDEPRDLGLGWPIDYVRPGSQAQ